METGLSGRLGSGGKAMPGGCEKSPVGRESSSTGDGDVSPPTSEEAGNSNEPNSFDTAGTALKTSAAPTTTAARRRHTRPDDDTVPPSGSPADVRGHGDRWAGARTMARP